MLHILVDKLPIVLPKTAVRNEAFELGECASRRVRAHTNQKYMPPVFCIQSCRDAFYNSLPSWNK